MSNPIENIVEDLKRLKSEQLQSGDFSSTIEYCRKVLDSKLEDWSVYFNIGKYLQQIGIFNLAIEFFEKAIGLNPEHSNIDWFIGDVYKQNLKNQEMAIVYFKKYAKKTPQDYNIYNIIGFLYQEIDEYEDLDEQIKYFQKSLELKPDFKVALRNLAFAYARAGDYEESIECLHKLLELGAVPDDYFYYACLKLMLGDFEEGWKYYEHRFLKEFVPTPYPEFDIPKWEGQDISDKTLLVHYEQGFGDSIQFFRYLPEVLLLSKKLIFRVQNDLLDLFKINSGGIEVVGDSTPIAELSFDYHIPLMNVPRILNATIDNIPLTKGYFEANKDKIQEMKSEFFNTDCFKIGISWHGSLLGKKNRNIPLECFYPLTRLKNVKIYSFQKGESEKDLTNLPPDVEIVNLGETFHDFSDTAAAMANLDLFVTGDNSLLNLAGAMGKKTFALLSKDSEWRWFLDTEKTPWYDSVKIFKKQHENDDWELTMEKVISSLCQ